MNRFLNFFLMTGMLFGVCFFSQNAVADSAYSVYQVNSKVKMDENVSPDMCDEFAISSLYFASSLVLMSGAFSLTCYLFLGSSEFARFLSMVVGFTSFTLSAIFVETVKNKIQKDHGYALESRRLIMNRVFSAIVFFILVEVVVLGFVTSDFLESLCDFINKSATNDSALTFENNVLCTNYFLFMGGASLGVAGAASFFPALKTYVCEVAIKTRKCLRNKSQNARSKKNLEKPFLVEDGYQML